MQIVSYSWDFLIVDTGKLLEEYISVHEKGSWFSVKYLLGKASLDQNDICCIKITKLKGLVVSSLCYNHMMLAN